MPSSTANSIEDVLRDLALAIAVYCARNTVIENYHSGKAVRTTTSDYSDVKVVTSERELRWSEVSRITDEEMKAFNIEVSNKVFTVLQYLLNTEFESDREEFLKRLSSLYPSHWDRPVMQHIDRSVTPDPHR